MKLTNKEIINYAQEFLNEDKTNKDITSKIASQSKVVRQHKP